METLWRAALALNPDSHGPWSHHHQDTKMSHLFPEGWSLLGTERTGRFWLRDYTHWQEETRPGRVMGELPAQRVRITEVIFRCRQ